MAEQRFTETDVKRVANNLYHLIYRSKQMAPRLWANVLQGRTVNYQAWARYALRNGTDARWARDYISGSCRMEPPLD